jgi:plasmid maintenance system killer protein
LEFVFADLTLERLYTRDEGTSTFPPETVKVFRRRVRHIEAAEDLRDLQDPRGLHCDKIEGTDRFLVGLTDGYGLIFSRDMLASRIVIHEISRREDLA